MVFSSHRIARRMLLALGATLFALSGCGSGNNGSPYISRSAGRPVALNLQGGGADLLAAYNLRIPPDPHQPFGVTVDGKPLQQGTDYSLDANMPAVLHITTNLSPAARVYITYTAPASITEVFSYTAGSKPVFTLLQPVDFTEPVAVDFAAYSREATSVDPVSNQNYAIQTASPTVFRLTKPFPFDGQLGVTYTPKTP